MSQAQNYSREKDGLRLDFKGVVTSLPPDRLPPGKYPYAQNVRRYTKEELISRAMQGAAVYTLGDPVQSIRRLNDTTPAGPPSGFIVVSTAGTILYANAVAVATGLSGERVSLVPFRPNASVQPWMYVADDNKMLKVRSDGTTFADGIEEPQDAPTAVFAGGATSGIFPIQYRYVYRGGDTGALSNPSPPSAPGFNQSGQQDGSDTLPTDITFDPAQWEFVGVQLRTTGAATSSPQLLNYVIGTKFGLNVPAGVTITGVQIDLNWQSQSNTTAQLQNVALYYQGNIIGNVKNPGTAPATVAQDALAGSAADTWGATLTPDIVNDDTFGFGIQIAIQTVRVFLNGFKVTVFYTQQEANVTPTASPDPQVTLIDFYRFGGGLEQYTYVGTGPNSATPFVDELTDLAAAANPILQFDNFQPFPSIDLPRSGTVSVVGGVVNWASGDQFNVRWLPGTIIVIGGVAWTLIKRPLSALQLLVDESIMTIPDQFGVAYSIQEPDLAAQPMRSMWGPTDNVAYMFACGDPLRPGTLYFTKGNNPDSAPDTNQMEVTSPSEPLMGGCIVNGLSLVGSTERFWLAYPNFFNALATVTGVQGSVFTLVLSISNRGLFAKAGICSDGGSKAFFIAKDGIYVSPGGNGSQSITDEDLYNIFPHEELQEAGQQPEDVTIGGYTVYAPDYTNPDAMALSFSNGFLYFDYQDRNGNPRTLVYDDFAKGWVVDVYQFPAISHESAEGPVDGVYVGCTDHTVRNLLKNGVETQTAVVLTPAFLAGDARALKQFGDLFIEAKVPEGFSIGVAVFSNKFINPVAGVSPTTLAFIDGNRNPYIIDFLGGLALTSVDVEAAFNWQLNADTGLFTWQPTLIAEPEGIQNRPTDWDDAGSPGAKFVQGFLMEADTFGQPKNFKIQSADDQAFFEPNEIPATFNGQSVQAFTFTPPFISHMMRFVSTDGVPIRIWGIKWVVEPYPEATVEWQSEGMSHGFLGWQHIRLLNIAHISDEDLTLRLVFDRWPPITVTVPNSGGIFTKTKVTIPENKFKIVSYRLSSTAPFRFFERDTEVWVKQWGSEGGYQTIRPFGGPSNQGAKV